MAADNGNRGATKAAGEVDAVVVGAGMAGLYMLIRLRRLGLSTVVLEAADDVGGTWYWNRYPGARCDIATVDYTYSFDPELEDAWTWSEKYATQPEILRYMQFVAERYDLRRDIRFETKVTAAAWDDDAGVWRITTDGGDTITARYYIMATGCLSVPKEPEIEGADDFRGEVYFTGRWPHEKVDFTGKRVAVIGTGSSGIQSIPLIAEEAEQLTVFQRTPNFSVPAVNGPIVEERMAPLAADREAYREAGKWSRGGVPREVPLEAAWQLTPEERRRRFDQAIEEGELFSILSLWADQGTDKQSNEYIAEMIRERIRDIVDDPEVAETLSPRDHAFGTKRPCLDTNYYATYNRPNVRLVDLRKTPIERITEHGVQTTDETVEVDALVYATGFDAMTGAIVAVDITGRDGVTLKEKWEYGPLTYLGLMSVGFPNLFLITGPGSPSVLSNMAVSIEQHVDWIADRLGEMAEAGFDRIEPTETAEAGWVQHVNDCADITLHPTANSWYIGANVPGKPRVFLPYIGGVDAYRGICDDVVARDMIGFSLSGTGGTQRNDGVAVRLQPDVKLVLEMMAQLELPPLESMSPADARAFMTAANAVRPPGPDVGEIVDGTLPGPAGDLDYRLYRPEGDGPHPIVLYFHGGGWVLGDQVSDDPFCRDLCVRSGAVIVSANYRHGPEDRFPAAPDDAFAAAAVGGGARRRARRDPRPAGRRRLERRRQPRRHRVPAGPRRRRPRDHRPAAPDAGHRLRPRHRLLPGERRRLRAHQGLDGVVLGPLRRRVGARRSPLLAAAGRRPVRPAPGVHRRGRVRPAARRGGRLRRGLGEGRRAGAAVAGPRPHAHVADDGRRDPLGRAAAGGDGRGAAGLLRGPRPGVDPPSQNGPSIVARERGDHRSYTWRRPLP